MASQTIVWTALPNGLGAGSTGPTAKLSVFVSPRLESAADAVLGDFGPHWLDWPRAVAEMSFQVQLTGGFPVNAQASTAVLRSDVWRELFGEKTFVRGYDFDRVRYYDRKVRSYPARHIRKFFKDLYAQIAAASPTDHPSRVSLRQGPLAQITFDELRDQVKAIESQIESTLNGPGRAVPFSAAPDYTKDFFQLERFHRPRNRLVPHADGKHKTAARVEPVVPKIDFHQMVATLADYPVLARMLGLVIDLEFPLPAPVASTNVRVIADLTLPGGYTPATPWTRCEVSTSSFRARPKAASDLTPEGMLRLSASQWELIEFDHDGSAIKALDFANNLYRAEPVRMGTQDTPTEFSLPSLRGGGISVARTGQAFKVAAALGSDKQRNDNLVANPLNVFMDADQLVRGYSVDVYDHTAGEWRQLCDRIGTFDIPPLGAPLKLQDEGFVAMGVTSASDPQSPKDLYLGETMWRWFGWSLAAPPPGKTVNPTPTNTDPTDPNNDTLIEGRNPAATDFPFAVTFAPAPGSLPMLRYGRTYQIRARVKDIAGNGPSVAAANALGFAHATSELTYARFEPIVQPVVLLRAPRTQGESLERVVIRSGMIPTDSLWGPGGVQACVSRHVAPPKVSMQTALECGLFDVPTSLPGQTTVSRDTYKLIADREPMSYVAPTPQFPWGIGDPATADPANHGELHFPADFVPVPYLPDPMARGALLRGVPGAAEMTVPFYDPLFDGDPWPNASAFRLDVCSASAAASVLAGQVLTCRVPPSEVYRVRYSCYPDAEQLTNKKLGLFNWLPAAEQAALLPDIAAGRHWMFTPFREMMLVGAARTPLTTPEFDNLLVIRSTGQTFCGLSDIPHLHNKSMSKVDLFAEWTEYVDQPAAPPTTKPVKVHVLETRVPLESQLEFREHHEFGDTKHREVTYSFSAFTRFSEYFQREAQVTLGVGPVTVDPSGDPVMEGSEVVTGVVGTSPRTFARSTDGGATGDYIVNGSTIERTATSSIPFDAFLTVKYLVPPHTRETQAPVTRHVPSSARPAAPKVLYIVPFFEWEEPLHVGGVKSNRRANGLRVYLERPWWSSGQDEKLGVVLWKPKVLLPQDLPDRVKPYATQWGMDPIWKSPPTKTLPALSDFPLATALDGNDLTLDEIDTDTFQVAGHDVGQLGPSDEILGYDAERDLYYCDIRIDAGDAYFPFVRLALARYQPYSTDYPEKVHLSRVVLTDFAQLAPDRFATVTFDHDATKVQVSVGGQSYDDSYAGPGPSLMVVQVQKRNAAVDDPDLGWVDSGAEQPLTATRPLRGTGWLWSGPVQLPGPRTAQTYRLAIKEYELFNPKDVIVPGGFGDEGPLPGFVKKVPQASRLVYVDVLGI